MNLINDLDTEIAFAVLVDKKHNEKIESKDILSLIGRLNKALEEISEENEDNNEYILNDNRLSQTAMN
jgi:hypothetical protein